MADTDGMNVAVPFPETQPKGYEWLEGEPDFDPSQHLQLEEPEHIVMLADLGYHEDEITGKATAVAASAPFRVLSEDGTAVMLETARRLEGFVKRADERIERVVRGGCYRSRWLRSLCTSPDINEHMSRIYGTEVAPHPMGLHLGHLNFQPSTVDTPIDKWHHDTLPLDYVLMVTDPATVPGGRFEYFVGTKAEAAELAAAGKTPPPDRTVAPEFPGPGWAIALHGDMVVHRAGALTEMAERISMVNGYVAMDTSLDEQSRSVDLITVDDPEVLWTEWAKMAAWRSKDRLQTLIDSLEFTDDQDTVTTALEAAIADATRAVQEMRGGSTKIAHYE